MRKILLTLTALCLTLFTQAQNTETMYIYYSDGMIEQVEVASIDSITFALPPTTPESVTDGLAIDLGLPSGIKWASHNVGATSPEEYGGYYAWGETEEKSNYYWDSYKHSSGISSTFTKYNGESDYGTVDNKTVLDLEDDVAHVKWGGNWRMPTKDEQDELATECTWKWTTLNGVNGYKVIGPNGNSIFLPAAGYYSFTDFYDGDSYGYYWSSSLSNIYPTSAIDLYFNKYYFDYNYDSRYQGQSVRPVCP